MNSFPNIRDRKIYFCESFSRDRLIDSFLNFSNSPYVEPLCHCHAARIQFYIWVTAYENKSQHDYCVESEAIYLCWTSSSRLCRHRCSKSLLKTQQMYSTLLMYHETNFSLGADPGEPQHTCSSPSRSR